ncbi:hypothetical protein [Herbiconiux ginsengi]|uniref:Uncharacterized protein n=1 Tax=Herbiconiux ginsengi TaxID=381665 RepID=A0A1H3K3Q2_9MICO|nr:hypothetical protein [Herbiconiux ginsengi]SDY46144.1 hypothetical protein SAMN05216554_0394 [Herbiconiux ginsengi]
MSSDDRQEDRPEFPKHDPEGEATAAPATPPLPDLPAWQPPAGAETATDAPEEPVEVTERVEVVDVIETESATREPLGGPYVVADHAPVAEQATAAYERQPTGGPVVTSSEPTPALTESEQTRTPYPAAAFAPAPPAAAAMAGAAYPPPYQPVPQPIMAPVPPTPRGNRGGGSLIALVGTVAFAVVYAAVAFVVISANVQPDAYVSAFSSFLTSAAFIVPIVVFAISLILIVLIVNRAGWWAYVLGGFLVAVLVYFGGIAGALIHVNAWNLQPQEQYDFVRSLVMDPLPLAGAIVAREASIWAGAWIALRGRKVKARNLAAREEFDRQQAEASAAATAAYGSAPGAAYGTTPGGGYGDASTTSPTW